MSTLSCVKSLRDMCMISIISQLKSLPPQILEEVIGETKKDIYKEICDDIKKTVTKDIVINAEIMISDLTTILKQSYGSTWVKPSYMENVDDELYQTCVNIAENNVQIYNSSTDYRHVTRRQRTSYNFIQENEYEENEENEDNE